MLRTINKIYNSLILTRALELALTHNQLISLVGIFFLVFWLVLTTYDLLEDRYIDDVINIFRSFNTYSRSINWATRRFILIVKQLDYLDFFAW